MGLEPLLDGLAFVCLPMEGPDRVFEELQCDGPSIDVVDSLSCLIGLTLDAGDGLSWGEMAA